MEITYDALKRAWTLKNRGLDFKHAAQVFQGVHLTIEDDRQDYGEVRNQTMGRLGRSVVVVVWTPRGGAHRIISMRKCNVEEREKYYAAVGY